MNPTRAGKVENRSRMTQFCNRNIPSQFVVQFISFLVSIVKKWFDRILTTFLGPGTTGARKVENLAWKTQFCTRNIPTLFGVHFIISRSTIEKCFGRVLMTFRVRAPPEQEKLKTGPR